MFAYLRRFAAPYLILIGLYACVGYAPWCAWQAHREASWPVVEGRMREVSAEPLTGSRRLWWWEVVLSYEYRVRGRNWIGDQWATGHGIECFTRAEAEARARDFLPGTNVTVHYDPEDPSQSALELGRARDAWLAFGCGLVFVALGFTRWRADRR